MKTGKRGATNIVATMLIFALMIASLGVLYSQISPTLLGHQAITQSTNQEFIFQSIANEVQDLVVSTGGSQSRVHIVAPLSRYSVIAGDNLVITVNDGGAPLTSQVANIGQFQGVVNGSFQPTAGISYLNRVLNEDTYLQNQSVTTSAQFVSKASYSRNQGLFDLYFRARLSLIETSPNNYFMTIIFVKIDFNPSTDGSPLDFPIDRDEWSLRLTRKNTTVFSDVSQTTAGAITVTQLINGNPGDSYNFPAISPGSSLTVRFLIVPILFGI